MFALFFYSCSNDEKISELHKSADLLMNQFVEVNGVVSGVYQGENQIDGFYIQENGFISNKGIFVHTDKEVCAGDEIFINAKLNKEYNQLILDSVKNIDILSKNNRVKIQNLSFPFNDNSIKNLEGCLVRIPDKLTISDTYSYIKKGQLLVSKNELIQPTELYDAQNQSKEIGILNHNQQFNSILLDDMLDMKFPEVESLYLSTEKIVLGNKISNIMGYISKTNKSYKIRVVNEPEVYVELENDIFHLNGKLTIASYNVHNLFNGDGLGGGFPTSRGAKTYEKYLFQIEKLAAAIGRINPDIIALMELENDGEDSLSSIGQLCGYLNSKADRKSYTIAYSNSELNGDQIKTGIIYDSLIVQVREKAKYYSSSIFSRAPLFQRFIYNDSLEFVLSVNHFKSKGSRGATGLDIDQGDGQGAYNHKRILQAEELLSIIKLNYDKRKMLVVGDFNSYSKEDPVQLLEKDLRKVPMNGYSYVYKGNKGNLDHVFVSDDFYDFVDVNVMNINVKYPNWSDYRFEFSDTTFKRSSDHNPLIIKIFE